MKERVLASLAGLALVASVAPADAAGEAKAMMKSAKGEDVGQVVLRETAQGTLLNATLKGLPAGAHAFHVHATGKCEPPFASAGGHYNPDGRKHGILADGGAHAGDMPNLHVPSSGTLELEVLNTRLKLDDKLFDADGAAVVIHAGADDYKSDPAGNAGDRIACGVIGR